MRTGPRSRSRSRKVVGVVATLLVSILLLTSCGDDDSAGGGPTPVPESTPTATRPTPTPVATPSVTVPTPTPAVTPTPASAATPTLAPTPTVTPATTPTVAPVPDLTVNVYWAWTIATTPGGSPERIGAGGRVVTTTEPAAAAVRALLAGPNALEAEIGMSTAIPGETELLGINIADGIATVDLSADFEAGSGTLAETIRVAQVVYTLTQFDSVDAVRFAIEGELRDFLASHGIDVSSPVDRASFVSVRPLILVERPYPGATFASGDPIVGESNTFEATVEYAVTDPEGIIIAEGFTTATAGNGTWGTFVIEVLLDTEVAGRGAVVVFETSARDGSQVHVVEYPVDLVGA